MAFVWYSILSVEMCALCQWRKAVNFSDVIRLHVCMVKGRDPVKTSFQRRCPWIFVSSYSLNKFWFYSRCFFVYSFLFLLDGDLWERFRVLTDIPGSGRVFLPCGFCRRCEAARDYQWRPVLSSVFVTLFSVVFKMWQRWSEDGAEKVGDVEESPGDAISCLSEPRWGYGAVKVLGVSYHK